VGRVGAWHLVLGVQPILNPNAPTLLTRCLGISGQLVWLAKEAAAAVLGSFALVVRH
jgi:hypothetical protein